MFYPVESLRRGGRFYLCWVADSWPLRFATITHRQLWSQDIREICNDLLEVMKNESGRPTKRFSLRLSSQLLRGLVRLYQRKVIVFVGDLCMINAHVMKSTHKKSNYDEIEHIKNSELPRLILEIQPDEEAVEEKIQNSGNIVAHIEDITLREPTLPENRILLDDGFGELNDQPIQVMLGERSVEMMLFKETSIQHSALDLPLDFSADKSLDKSRLYLREAQMERLSENDISMFGKSMGEGVALGDFEKEIPVIPDLPHPDPPHTDKELETDENKEKEIEKSKLSVPDEIVLEELEEQPQVKRRKLKNKLIIDKKIQLSSDYIRSRIVNTNVETRCEVIFAPPSSRPPLAGPPVGPLAGPLGGAARPLGAALGALWRSGLERLDPRGGEPHGPQEALFQRKEQLDMRTILEKIDEEVETIFEKCEGNLEVQDVSKQMDVTYANIQEVPEILIQGLTDPMEIPTQKLPEISQAQKRVSENQQSPILQPKRRRCNYVSFRHNQQKFLEPSTSENIPEVAKLGSARLTALLQRDGLADSESADTPLGSLDRTKVSLGDSDRTTDSKKFIREEWGTQGAMHKIYRCIKSGDTPVDVERLMSAGPLLSGHKRVIAARCFTSILKLKQHGFIQIYKDSESYEIKNITLGSKIIQDK